MSSKQGDDRQPKENGSADRNALEGRRAVAATCPLTRLLLGQKAQINDRIYRVQVHEESEVPEDACADGEGDDVDLNHQHGNGTRQWPDEEVQNSHDAGNRGADDHLASDPLLPG